MPKIAICGHGRSGKDTTAEMLAEMSTLRYIGGTSLMAADIVWERWGRWEGRYVNHELEKPLWPTPQSCWNDRREHREKWAEIIGEYNQGDPVRFYRYCLENQDILTGIRWKHEQEACRTAGIVDLWIWIDRNVSADPTMTFGPEQCDIIVSNRGTKLQLKLKLLALMKAMGTLKHA